MPISLLIVEDEPMAAQRLERLSTGILGNDLETRQTASSVETAEDILSAQVIDLILLDLNLAGSDGFDLLKRFTAKAAHTIVVSAETSRAIEAYEFGVLDFVAKPFTRPRLEKALRRFWQPTGEPERETRQLAFEAGRGVEIIAADDILFFKGADKYSEATLKDGSVKFHSKSLNRLEDILSERFIRSHKSYLVSANAVRTLRSLEGSRYEISLADGSSLPVGRTRVDQVRHLLESLSAQKT